MTVYPRGVEPAEFDEAMKRWPRRNGESRAKYNDRVEGLMRLAEMIKPGDTLTTVMRHVSSSGMYRAIDVYLLSCEDGRVARRWLSRWIAMADIGRWDDKRQAVGVPGVGMDMGFHIVYNLSYLLFRDGFRCTGKKRRCPSNDHNNPPYPPRDGRMKHDGDGGYALNHEWLG